MSAPAPRRRRRSEPTVRVRGEVPVDAQRSFHRLRELWSVLPKTQAGVVLAGMLIVATVDFGFLRTTEQVRHVALESPLDRALYERLQKLHRAWEPKEHARLLEALVADCRDIGLTAPLARLLQHAPHDPEIPAGLEVATVLGDPTLASSIRLLAEKGPRHYRPAAWMALQVCGEVTEDDMWPLLRPEDYGLEKEPRSPELLAAALRVSHRLPEIEWTVYRDAMASEHEVVRIAAVEAFPEKVTDEAVESLLEMVGDSNWLGEQSKAAARVLSERVELERIVGRLVALLDGSSADPALVLTILTAGGRPLEGGVAANVWTIALDSGGPALARAAAWRCLEETRTPVPAEVNLRNEVFLLDRSVRYFAARYLLALGELASGVEVLIEYLPGLEADAPDALSLDARALLCQVTRLPGSSEASEFREWARANQKTWIANHIAAPRATLGEMTAAPPF